MNRKLLVGVGFIFCAAFFVARFGLKTEEALPSYFDFDEEEINGFGRS